MEEGYLDGLAGRDNRMCSPNYAEGWERGWRERMMTWKETTCE
jgi:ribosome modulation factor